jgi:hypothetical protein
MAYRHDFLLMILFTPISLDTSPSCFLVLLWYDNARRIILEHCSMHENRASGFPARPERLQAMPATESAVVTAGRFSAPVSAASGSSSSDAVPPFAGEGVWPTWQLFLRPCQQTVKQNVSKNSTTYSQGNVSVCLHAAMATRTLGSIADETHRALAAGQQCKVQCRKRSLICLATCQRHLT